MTCCILAVEHPDGLLAPQSLSFGSFPASSPSIEISPEVFVPTFFTEVSNGHAAVATYLTDARGTQRPVALFYCASYGSVSLASPEAYLAEREGEIQQCRQDEALLWSRNQQIVHQHAAASKLLESRLVEQKHLEDEVARLQTVAAQAHTEAQASHAACANLAASGAEQSMELRNEIERTAAATVQIDSLGQRLVQALEDAASLRGQVSSQVHQLDGAAQQYRQLQSEGEAAAVKLKATDKALSHTTAMYQKLREEHRHKQHENDRAASTLSELTEQLHVFQEQLELVDTDCSAEKHRADAAEEELVNVQACNSSLGSQLATALSELGVSHEKCQAREAELLQAQNSIHNKHEAAQNLRAQLCNAQGHIEWLKETHDNTLQVSSDNEQIQKHDLKLR